MSFVAFHSLSTFLWRIIEVRNGAPVDVGLQQYTFVEVDVAGLQVRVGGFYALKMQTTSTMRVASSRFFYILRALFSPSSRFYSRDKIS